MKLVFDNVRVRVPEATSAERAWLFEFLSFRDGSGTYRGKKGARFRLYNMIKHEFPTGNLGSVVREYKRLGTLPTSGPAGAEKQPAWWVDSRLQIVDTRVKPCEAKPNPSLDWLYWYQGEAVDACIARGRGIVKVPTGGGKTEIAVALKRAFPCRWLFVAHRAQLMNNGADRYVKRERERLERELSNLHALEAAYDFEPGEFEAEVEELEEMIESVRAGRFGDGIDDVLESDTIVFATFQGLYAALNGRGGEILRWAQGIIIDECHVQPADTFYAVTQTAVNAYYRFGLSGTPLARGDKRNVLAIGALGKMLYKIRTKTLIDEGIYAYPRMRFVECDQSSEVPGPTKCRYCKGEGMVDDLVLEEKVVCEACKGSGAAKQKFPTIYKHAVVESKIRERVSTQIAKRMKKPGMVFVEKLDHGKRLKKAFERAGVTCRFVSGKKKTEQRDKALHDLVRGHLDLVITTRVMQEGIDVPSLASVFNAAAMKSPIGVLQKVGRGARTTEAKGEFEVWDIFDKGHTNLRKQANARKKALRDETECPVEVVPEGQPLPIL